MRPKVNSGKSNGSALRKTEKGTYKAVSPLLTKLVPLPSAAWMLASPMKLWFLSFVLTLNE